jgi:hypothetical protein
MGSCSPPRPLRSHSDRFLKNRKNELCRRRDLNPHALAGNGF